jgi:hypothetical protein
MSEFVNNKNADFTKNLPDPELEVQPNLQPTKPIEHKPNPIAKTLLPPEPEEDMPIPTVDETIFKLPEPVKPPSPVKIKKKRQLSERQLAHLARMREKSLKKRQLKKQQKELEKQQKLKAKELKKVQSKPIPKPSLPELKTIPEEIKQAAKKSKKPEGVSEFFSNVNLFLETMDRYNKIKKKSEPIPIPKKTPQIVKPQIKKQPAPVYQPPKDLYAINLNQINRGNFRNPFGF